MAWNSTSKKGLSVADLFNDISTTTKISKPIKLITYKKTKYVHLPEYNLQDITSDTNS
jgi:hypothetical protein